ncbi:MAG: ATP-binding protein [Planctomycetota bacterium]|nr:ATP-binding protein [Planctomycetota bacterium]
MAKKFVRISLATKFRVLFGVSVLGVIAAALVLPWYFVESLSEQGLLQPGAELSRLALNEFVREHPQRPDAAGDVAALYTTGLREGRAGPSFIKLTGTQPPPLDSTARHALKAFRRKAGDKLAVIRSEGDRGQTVYRCFRAVRIERDCLGCHGSSAAQVQLRHELGELVGMIDVTLPGSTATDPEVWWTRGAFVAGAMLAGLVAFVLFAIITQRLVLRPVRKLSDMTDKVAEGDLAVRSGIDSGDELQRLGESFNEMLDAISTQHEKLRAANRALDLRLHELAEVNVTLFQANKVKSEFLTNISHELRTPLNSIIGFADLLGECDEQRIRRYGQNISSAAKNLLNMINDLLDLAKIEAGKAQVRLDKTSVTDTCRTLLTLIRPLAEKKQIELQAQLTENLPIVLTDGGKLQQILYNLLSNAVKFTPAGGRVTLSTATHSVQRAGKATDEVSIAVADTGPGIAEADQQLVFEKFHQLDRTLTRESSGTGLGLAIAKELTNLLDGRLTVQSSPGHGAVFTLFMPTHPRPKAQSPAKKKK